MALSEVIKWQIIKVFLSLNSNFTITYTFYEKFVAKKKDELAIWVQNAL